MKITSVSESCSNTGWPICFVTRKALESIGKVSRHESQINGMIGSIVSYSDNDEDNNFNVEFSDIDTLEYYLTDDKSTESTVGPVVIPQLIK